MLAGGAKAPYLRLASGNLLSSHKLRFSGDFGLTISITGKPLITSQVTKASINNSDYRHFT